MCPNCVGKSLLVQYEDLLLVKEEDLLLLQEEYLFLPLQESGIPKGGVRPRWG
jgi:hypothetical protein